MIIYSFKNKTNGKIYVGRTSTSFKQRTQEHLRRSTTYFGKALKKYGIDNFDYQIIDTADTQEELNEKEIYWISKLNSLIPNGYNLCKGGRTSFGYHHTEETKKKISVTKLINGNMKGEKNHYYNKKHSDEIRQKMKEAWVNEERHAKLREQNKNLDRTYQQKKVINVDTGEVFDSIKEAAMKYHLKETHISRVCRGKRKRTGGFRWKYFD